MDRLSRPVGLGLAARGEVSAVVSWSTAARAAGLDSVWIHDSYFERDAVTYVSAIASQLGADETPDGFRIALGAVNPYTRHPVALAMTGSALDEMAPGRIVMALGTGLPLRLRQMGIPYELDEAVDRVSTAMDQLRTLWAGERLPSATPGLPPIQPMFEPPHRIPLAIAAYRKELVALAGQKADGYLARPAESIPSLRGILERLDQAALAAGRDPASIETAGYLLTLVDRTRREALNRAKREPFVIYMLSVLSDISLARAGFDRQLRDRVAAAWRAEDYHTAAGLIPDELLDAFMLCGTREDVAARAMAFHAGAGLALPLLQPVVQEERQIGELLAAAEIYAKLPEPAAAREDGASGRPVTVAPQVPAGAGGRIPAPGQVPPIPTELAPGGPAPRPGKGGLADDRRLGSGPWLWRRLGATWEILRPFAYTASAIPVAAGGALAFANGRFNPGLFLLALVGGMLLHSGTNIINEIYDVRQGIDTITSPRASHAIVKGRVSEHGAYALAIGAFALATLLGVALIIARGLPIAVLGILGLAAGYFYTAPPFQYKYRALGVPLVFVLMGPIMTLGGYFAASGSWSLNALVLSIPVGCLVAAILHGNEWRDISEDTRAGIVTLSARIGKEVAHYAYLGLILGAYMTLAIAVALRLIPIGALLAILSLPFLAQVLRSAELGASGQARAIAMIDLQTARLHLAFGSLLVIGVAISVYLR
ncbi:MAG: LLM class flavin-dependent oxidoreductase [Candidatus Limnocylindrales bacterium]